MRWRTHFDILSFWHFDHVIFWVDCFHFIFYILELCIQIQTTLKILLCPEVCHWGKNQIVCGSFSVEIGQTIFDPFLWWLFHLGKMTTEMEEKLDPFPQRDHPITSNQDHTQAEMSSWVLLESCESANTNIWSRRIPFVRQQMQFCPHDISGYFNPP